MRYITIILLLLLTTNVFAINSDDAGYGIYQPRGVFLEAGLMGRLWNPGDIEPYENDKYGRGVLHLETGIYHPLEFIHKEVDIFDLPSLTLETNFGAENHSASLSGITPGRFHGKSWLHTNIWTTWFRFISIAWEYETFEFDLNDPTNAFGEGTISQIESLHKLEYERDEFRIGIIGTLDESWHEIMVEIGYYNFALTRPIALYTYYTSVTNPKPELFVPRMELKGLYSGISFEPVENVWPVRTYFGMNFATGKVKKSYGTDLGYLFASQEDNPVKMFGLDLQFDFEREINKNCALDFYFHFDWNLLSAEYSPLDSGRNFSLTPIDRRMTAGVNFIYSLGLENDE